MSRNARYAWRFRLNDSETTLEVWSADEEAACQEMRDTALGLAARLQEWAMRPESRLCRIPAGCEPPNYWANEQEAAAWSERSEATGRQLD